MTPEEIKKIASEYARLHKVSASEAYYENKRNIEADDILPIIQWLSERYCIVPRSKVKEWQLIVEDALKADHVITEDAWRFMWERLFGKDMFEEEGK